MRMNLRGSVLLAGAILGAVLALAAPQAVAENKLKNIRVNEGDVAVLYTTERAKTVNSGCNCFWLQGVTLEGAGTVWRGAGVVASLTTQHKSNISPGVNLGKITFAAGPRYTWNYKTGPGRRYKIMPFAQMLFGLAHGYDSVFPSSNGTVSSSANSFSFQLGGGADIPVKDGFAVRPIQLEYVHTALSNGYSNAQNDFRISVGASWHFGRTTAKRQVAK